MDLLKGIIFLVIYIRVLETIGGTVFKKSSFFMRLISGYMIYYVGQFFLGFLWQILSLPIMIYHILTGIILLAVLVYSLKGFTKEGLLERIKEHFKTYYLVYLVSFVLLFLSVMYYPGHMLSNNVDDGYYVMKIINFVKGVNVNIDPATGFEEHMYLKTKIARMVNTYELDLASYCYLFKIDVLVFVNYIYTWFNYYFTLAVLVVFFEKIFEEIPSKKLLTTGIVGTLFFAMYPKYFELLRVYIQDAWQFNTAMWYGSSICRIPALMILCFGLWLYEKQYIKQVIYVICCSIVFMSKGTQILPVLVYVGFIYCMNLLWDTKVNKIIKILPIPLFAGLSMILDHLISYTSDVGVNINSLVSLDIKSPVMLLIIGLFIVMMVVYRHHEKLLKWNWIIVFMLVFSLIDPINDVLTTFSIYYFVAARATTLFFYSLVMTLVYELVVLIMNTKFEKVLKVTGVSACIVFTLTCFVYIGKNAIDYVRVNPKLTYQSIIDLSQYLNQLDQDNGKEDVRVVAHALYMVGKNPITPSSNLRYYANEVTVVSLETRYGCNDETNVVSYYSEEDEDLFEELNNGNVDVFDTCAKTWEKTNTNTVILTTNTLDEQMESIGYTCIHEIQDQAGLANFYVYYQE